MHAVYVSQHTHMSARFSVLIGDHSRSESFLGGEHHRVAAPPCECTPVPKTESLTFRMVSTSTTACSKSTRLKTLLRVPTNNFHPKYHTLVYSFQLIILAILATRMHLHLWHADRHLHRSDALMIYHMSDVSSVGRTAWLFRHRP